MCMCIQVKVLDADVMEAQGYKGAAAVADELRSLLEGSKRVGVMKAAESEGLGDAFNAMAQVCGWLCTIDCRAAPSPAIAVTALMAVGVGACDCGRGV